MTLRRSVLILALGLTGGGNSLAAQSTAASTARAEIMDPAQALRALQREHDALLAQQPALREAADRVAELEDQNRQLDQQLQGVQAQLDGTREEAAQLRRDDRRRWFVVGASVFGVGALLGLLLPLLRGRRRGYGGFR